MDENLSRKMLTRIALLVALSAIAAYIPLPSPVGTVALDSAPGYLAVFLFGGIEGGLVLGIGHLFSSLKMGFPLGLIHLFIALGMAGCGLLVRIAFKKYNILIAIIIGVILNGVVIPLFLIPLLGWGFFLAMLGPLMVGSVANIFLAGLCYRLLIERIGITGERG